MLITLIGPDRTADLVVDADTPVEELLPNLLAAGGVSESAREEPGWGIALMGKQPIEREQTLEQCGVLDGAVLVLRRDSDAPAEAVIAPALGGPAGSPLERTRAAPARPAGAGPARLRAGARARRCGRSRTRPASRARRSPAAALTRRW